VDRAELIESLLKRWYIAADREQTRRAVLEYLTERQPDEVLCGGVRMVVLAPAANLLACYCPVNIENLGPGEVTSIVIVHMERSMEARDYAEIRRVVFQQMTGAFAKLAGLDDAQCEQIAKQEDGLPPRAN